MIIWGLTDDRAGNSGQVIGLAEALGLPYIEQKVIYNNLAKLPNLIRSSTLIGLKNKEILNQDLPDLLITAGRRCAPIALHIKKLKPSCKLVQIMSPDGGEQDFDLIILPEHDRKNDLTNVITNIGALHKLNYDLLKQQSLEWASHFSHLPKPYNVVLIGGNSKNGKFTLDHARELGQAVNQMAISNTGSLLITSSRRTDEKARKLFEQQLTAPYSFFHWGSNSANPYLGYLALADIMLPETQ